MSRIQEGAAQSREESWPALPLETWKETRDTLHRWTQMVGKLRLAHAPPVNHWWHVTLELTDRGLTTRPIPDGTRSFQIDFDFLAHELVVTLADGRRATLPLRARTVASFYGSLMSLLGDLDIDARIWPVPVEVEEHTPFDRDLRHASYDPEAAERCWRALLQAGRVLERFRSGFVGKCSPVQFWWGGFDLAVSRYSGRRAPEHPPVPGVPDRVVREAYSHEVASVGFWPGDERFPNPAFYAYAYPAPPGFPQAPVAPDGAYYHEGLAEFILPYDRVRAAPDPDAAVAAFLESTYGAAADLGGWDRAALER
jgi:hypothetical protein